MCRQLRRRDIILSYKLLVVSRLHWVRLVIDLDCRNFTDDLGVTRLKDRRMKDKTGQKPR